MEPVAAGIILGVGIWLINKIAVTVAMRKKRS